MIIKFKKIYIVSYIFYSILVLFIYRNLKVIKLYYYSSRKNIFLDIFQFIKII